ncbi:hypothetical protein [Clostridioides sp. ZZV15-6598]|nr:hypothetical protein [Clostridioides sp. ZZV15-6598]
MAASTIRLLTGMRLLTGWSKKTLLVGKITLDKFINGQYYICMTQKTF